MTAVRISDVIVPAVFSPYTMALTTMKSRILQSGMASLDPTLSANLAGAGMTFNEPFFKDLADTDANISSDDPSVTATPLGITTGQEIQIRLERNQSWSSMQLASTLIGTDPMGAIANRVSDYWVRQLQKAVVATVKGVFANNDATTDAYHTQYDMTYDIKGSTASSVTRFSGEAFTNACLTMGDSMDELNMLLVHSVVYAQMLKNNMITFIPVSINGEAKEISAFLGREVIVDDSMPQPSSGVFESWIFKRGALAIGMNTPRLATELFRIPGSGNGAGQDQLFNRVSWMLHPVGHAWAGSTTNGGGPSNAATSGNLAHAASWNRVFPERKQIGIARLITREF
jgi:hypothetical protein